MIGMSTAGATNTLLRSFSTLAFRLRDSLIRFRETAIILFIIIFFFMNNSSSGMSPEMV